MCFANVAESAKHALMPGIKRNKRIPTRSPFLFEGFFIINSTSGGRKPRYSFVLRKKEEQSNTSQRIICCVLGADEPLRYFSF